jgi:hypothetical protein
MLFPLIIALALGCAFCIVLWSRAKATTRRKAIRRYCDEHGFDFLDSHLPATLDLNRSSLKGVQSISSAFTGMGSRNRFVFFDCWLRPGKRGYTQSVLAIHLLAEPYPACRWDRGLREEHVGEWTLIYHDERDWSVREIDAHLSAL